MTGLISSLRSVLEHSGLFPGEELLIEVFLNPASGLLARSEGREKLESLLGEVDRGEVPEGRGLTVTIHEPAGREECLAALEKASAGLLAFPGKAVLLTAGGDGFHRDCLAYLLQTSPSVLDKIILFRLPLGTGNDTPLQTDPAQAVRLLAGQGSVKRESLIQVDTARGKRDYALNVASFGLDAFVCLLTEKWKGRIGGDIYKVMVDLSTLFYDFYHRTRVSRITLFPDFDSSGEEKGGPPKTIEKRVLIHVFGRRGDTRYGGGKRILPGPENHLITGMFHLPGRIMLKGLFMKGGHWPGRKKVDFFRTKKMILSYPARLLMELDGELTLLEKEDFPLVLTRLDSRLRVLN
ncbi:MAG: diacylglycerol kinase family protein [Spirochaetales bacterium]|nr:diacylglycerol kinase family protein [Spirochaetales bacterium]